MIELRSCTIAWRYMSLRRYSPVNIMWVVAFRNWMEVYAPIKAILISGLVFLLDTLRFIFELFFVCWKKIVCFGVHADPPKCRENTDIAAG